MSKVELRIKQSKKYPTTTSVVLNEYRVGGVKWNDIDDGNTIIANVDKEDVLIALEINQQIAELKKQLEEKDKKIETLQTHFKKTQELLAREMGNSNIVIDNLQKETKQALASQKDFYEKKLHSQPKEIVKKIKKKLCDRLNIIAGYGQMTVDEFSFFVESEFTKDIDEILKEYGEKK